MKKKHISTLLINLIILLYACKPYPKEVEQALTLAGDNKQELIKVLNHYKNKDKLKFNAACFLISNMPYHKSKSQLKLPTAYFLHFKKVDSICLIDSNAINNDSLKHIIGKEFDSILPPTSTEIQCKNDIELLSADFLIDNIEIAFDEWNHSPLLKQLSFDEFKEWILPYRTVDESLVDNKRLLRSIIKEKLTKKGMNNILHPIDYYQKYVRLQRAMHAYITSTHHVGTFDPFIPAFKMDCHNLAARTCNYFRASGIPVVYEFTPQWPDKNSRHYWCASPDSNHILQPYTPPYNNLGEDWDLSLKFAGKVYQKTFGAMKNTPYFLKSPNESIPPFFDIATIKDVTERYHICTTLTLPFYKNTPNNIAYLSFFNTEKELTPVAWGEINKNKHTVTFYQVPINTVFFPSYLSEEGIEYFYKPLLLYKDSISGKIIQKDIECSKSHKINIHLLRKYPYKNTLAEYRKNLQGACLLGSDSWNGLYDTLLIIKNIPEPYWQEYQLNKIGKYRYYRFTNLRNLPMDIAEIEFLGRKDTKHTFISPTPLPIFSKSVLRVETDEFQKAIGTPIKTGPLYANFFDGNPETFARWKRLGIDFKSPICITQIRLLPRTAINIIEPNCNYKLLYFKDNQWIEYQNITSEYNYLDIDSIPANTIYWLRNLDKGKEELPFFYKNGKQIFINQCIQL